MIKKWEYKVIDKRDNYYNWPGGTKEYSLLEDMGNEGWELCGPPLCISKGLNAHIYYWKRELPQPSVGIEETGK